MRNPASDAYSIDEIAAAAKVSATRVRQAMRASGVPATGRFVNGRDAVAIVRSLRRGIAALPGRAVPLSLMPEPKRRQAGPLALSAVAHAAFLLLMLAAASLGLLKAADTEETVPEKTVTHLVYLIQP